MPTEDRWDDSKTDKDLARGFAWKIRPGRDVALATVHRSRAQFGDDLYHWDCHPASGLGKLASGTSRTMQAGKDAADAALIALGIE